MNNYWPKNPFYIFSKKSLLGLLFILSLNFVFGQAKINIHFVSTDDKAIISPEQKIEIQQFGRAVNVQVEVDQTLHPQKGSLTPVNYNDTMPYYSAEMRKIRDTYLNRSKSKTNKDY